MFAPSIIFIKAPLTTPPTDSKLTKLVLQILEHIRQRHVGVPVSQSGWHAIRVQRGEYNDLLTLLENEKSLWAFAETKLKYI